MLGVGLEHVWTPSKSVLSNTVLLLQLHALNSDSCFDPEIQDVLWVANLVGNACASSNHGLPAWLGNGGEQTKNVDGNCWRVKQTRCSENELMGSINVSRFVVTWQRWTS